MKLFSFKAFSLSFLTLMSMSLSANINTRSSLKSNGEIVYNLPQQKAYSLGQLFSKGNFYGRLRSNTFLFSKDDSIFKNITESSVSKPISALGASLLYKSASYHGFDFNIGLYTSYAFFDKNDIDSLYKIKGKDTFSRFNYANYGEQYMAVLGQANVGYTLNKTKLTAGRQLVETFYTRSNDTKMMPNTFDGLVLNSKDIQDSTLTLAYLVKQKLRDHTTLHSLLMYGDENSSSLLYPQWNENDDSVMHRGLTYTALKAAGKSTNAPLLVLDFQNKSIKELKINLASYIVPSLISQVMGELNYSFQLGKISVTPGIRYIKQFDNGAGAVGGAALFPALAVKEKYKDYNSLNSQMIAARVVTKFDTYKINLAYTQVFDEADLVTPWRGFPTSGYTRSMGIYNWFANTKSYRLELVKNATDTGLYDDLFIQTSVLYVNGDEEKFNTDNFKASDSMYYYIGFVQNAPSLPDFQYRLRLGYRDFIESASNVPNYLDSRLEFNYLF